MGQERGRDSQNAVNVRVDFFPECRLIDRLVAREIDHSLYARIVNYDIDIGELTNRLGRLGANALLIAGVDLNRFHARIFGGRTLQNLTAASADDYAISRSMERLRETAPDSRPTAGDEDGVPFRGGKPNFLFWIESHAQ